MSHLTVSIEVPHADLRHLDQVRRRHGISRSGMARIAMRVGLATMQRDPDGTATAVAEDKQQRESDRRARRDEAKRAVDGVATKD